MKPAPFVPIRPSKNENMNPYALTHLARAVLPRFHFKGATIFFPANRFISHTLTIISEPKKIVVIINKDVKQIVKFLRR